MVHQEFKLFPSLTVAENVVFRAEPRRGGLFLDRRAAIARVEELAARFGLSVDPTARVERLSVGMLQRVEILKALHREARILILDEPTAVLTPQEADALFETLRGLRGAGRTVVIVTHKLREVLEFSDRITVLRDGRSVARLVTAETSPAEVARHMVGRDVDIDGHYEAGEPAAVALRVEDLVVHNSDGVPVVRGVSFQARHGEIVGIAGVAGNGQTELLEAIAGLAHRAVGVVEVDGRSLDGLSAAARRLHGVAYIPEDRREVGSAAKGSVAHNLALGFHRTPPIRKGWRLDHRALARHAAAIIETFGIKVSTPRVAAETLSGGNLQKLVVGREMTHDATVLLVDQPTRGVDVGAIENIRTQLRRYRDAGNAIVLVSSELTEILALADRILVMFSGRLVGVFPRREATESALGLAMAGIDAEAVGR
jgi:simple sugar transport system ATP-binding protein